VGVNSRKSGTRQLPVCLSFHALSRIIWCEIPSNHETPQEARPLTQPFRPPAGQRSLPEGGKLRERQLAQLAAIQGGTSDAQMTRLRQMASGPLHPFSHANRDPAEEAKQASRFPAWGGACRPEQGRRGALADEQMMLIVNLMILTRDHDQCCDHELDDDVVARRRTRRRAST
jgi:hypothetical protein